MTATIPKAGTSQEEGPEGRAEDAIRPWLQEVAKPGPQDPVQLDHVNRSPSRTQSQCQKKTRQLGSPLQTSILGPSHRLGQT